MEKREATKNNLKEKALPRKVRIQIPEAEHRRMVAEAAYYIGQKRGSANDPVADWLAAEKEIEELLMDTQSTPDKYACA